MLDLIDIQQALMALKMRGEHIEVDEYILKSLKKKKLKSIFRLIN